MARVRSPARDEAFEIYKKNNGKITLREIAKQLDVPEKSISGWKVKDKWNDKINGVLHKNKQSTPKQKEKKLNKKISKKCSDKAKSGWIKEEYPKMKRVNNKNAITTGEFETLFFDTLDEDELILVNNIQVEKRKLLEQEIQLLTVRERRMLKRIAELRSKDMTVVSVKSGIEKGQDTDLTEYKGTLDQIQNIEEALTRVQEKKQKAIDLIHKFELDEQKLELAKIKSGAYEEEEEVEDDGFIAALGNKVTEVWSDEENS